MYKNKTFLKAYTLIICGINGLAMWPRTNEKPFQCQQFKKQRGMPKKARKLQSDEVRTGGKTRLRRNYIVVRYSKCGQEYHNGSTCDKRTRTSSVNAGNAATSLATSETI